MGRHSGVGRPKSKTANTDPSEAAKSALKPYQAAALVDKNSRTMVKILELLELSQKPDAPKIDPEGLTNRRIEKLKARLCRRLVKLAKWSDIPESERQPPPAYNKTKDSRGEQKYYPYSGVGIGTVLAPVGPVPAPVMSKKLDGDRAAKIEGEKEEEDDGKEDDVEEGEDVKGEGNDVKGNDVKGEGNDVEGNDVKEEDAEVEAMDLE